MSETLQQHSDEQLGPIDLIAVEFPDGRPSSGGFEVLADLAERDVIRILDVEFVAKAADGTQRLVGVEEVGGAGGIDLSGWEGASSGLLDESDIAEVGAEMVPGGVAVVVVFENRWVTGLVDAWRSAGARLIAEGGIPATDLIEALDATETP